MRRNVYRIRGRAEEADCEYCGCPLYSGDIAVLLDSGEIVCSLVHEELLIIHNRLARQAERRAP